MEVLVDKNEAGSRLDLWITKRMGISRKIAKKTLDAGAVFVNGRKTMIAKWELSAGDSVRILSHAPNNRERERLASKVRVEVLHEDKDLIAVAKPAGIIVVPEVGLTEATMVDQVRAYLKRTHPGARGTYVKALHRLDRDTTGILLLAKSHVGEQVISQFKRHTIGREYQAIVHGPVEKEQGTIRLALSKGEFGGGRKVAPTQFDTEEIGNSKKAITNYRVIERYPTATLLNVSVETGRTHQIRVHLASIGHPLLGDRQYGPQTDPVLVMRQALHAYKLTFRHPTSGEKIQLRLAPPEDFAAVIDALRSSV